MNIERFSMIKKNAKSVFQFIKTRFGQLLFILLLNLVYRLHMEISIYVAVTLSSCLNIFNSRYIFVQSVKLHLEQKTQHFVKTIGELISIAKAMLYRRAPNDLFLTNSII